NISATIQTTPPPAFSGMPRSNTRVNGKNFQLRNQTKGERKSERNVECGRMTTTTATPARWSTLVSLDQVCENLHRSLEQIPACVNRRDSQVSMGERVRRH